MVLAVLWYISFILASNVFVIAALAATWYFDPDRNGIYITTAVCWAWGYHLGSIAFGSLIVALIWFA